MPHLVMPNNAASEATPPIAAFTDEGWVPASGPILRLCVIADTDARPELLAHARCDLLCALGDLSDETILWYAHRLGNPPVVAVRGNHDVDWPFASPVQDVHGRVIQVAGLTVGGFGGCHRYKAAGHHLYEQEEVATALLMMPRVDVFLAHNSPRGIAERDDWVHVGFDAFADYVELARPAFFLHGHQHHDHVTRVGDTVVVGTYGHRVLEIPRP